ncbi:hypothetical protein BgAZ_502530 [Babesia gibsoni]|uniref:Uncharacterized protein n=1 Tax=Babesia gibsoni TaxID=33632 RepID=A0AAD8LML6_BABGI|nr:hypothetical protein BgAZ_502530 [Babesia gibsoni]
MLMNRAELLKLVDRQKCKDYELLGEAILEASQKGNNYCYERVAPVLCERKYTSVKPHFNCEHIKSKFMAIMKGCLLEQPSEGKDRNCVGLNAETFAISDPLVFCRMNYVSKEADGNQVSFKHNELDDCQALAQNYNHCQIIGKAFNHPKFCIDGGYQGYCNYYVHKIHDDAYRDLCRDVVLPYIFSNLAKASHSLSTSFCKTADEDIEKELVRKRDDLMERRQQIIDKFDSDFAIERWKKDMTDKINSMKETLQGVVKFYNTANSSTYNIFKYPYNFDPLVRSEFTKGVDLCNQIKKYAKDLPQQISDTIFLIRNIQSLFNLDIKLQETLIHFKQLCSLISSGSHSTIIATRYYKPVDHNALVNIMNMLNKLNVEIPQRLAVITSFLAEQTPEGSKIEQASHDAANELQFIATLYESQLSSFLKGMHKRRGKAFSSSITAA